MKSERKKIDTIVFISTGYRGGANKYLENNINYLSKKNLFLIDDNPNKNYKGIKNKNIDLYKIKPLKEASELKLFFMRCVNLLIRSVWDMHKHILTKIQKKCYSM